VVIVTPRLGFSPGVRTPDTHCTGGWVDLRAGLDTEVRGKIVLPLPGIEPQVNAVFNLQVFYKGFVIFVFLLLLWEVCT
jgi:hypothetical protein